MIASPRYALYTRLLPAPATATPTPLSPAPITHQSHPDLDKRSPASPPHSLTLS